MNFSFDFSRKRVLVTGGVSGIGRAVSMAFLAAGAEVVACGLTEAGTGGGAGRSGLRPIQVVKLDVTDKAAVDALIAAQPSLDVVVTSAGIIRRDGEHDPEVFDQVIDVNLSGSMRVASAARPLLARSEGLDRAGGIGDVVLRRSAAARLFGFQGRHPQPDDVARLCLWPGEGIRVNAVAPGWVVTDLSKGARENIERNAMIMARSPLGRWAQPAEIADPVLFLAPMPRAS